MKVQGDPENPMIIGNADGEAIGYTDAAGYPDGATVLQGSSGDKQAAAAVVTLASAALQTAYLTGFDVSFTGATATSTVLLTITGLLGGARSYVVVVPAGVTTAGTSIVRTFDPPLPAADLATDIVVTLPSLGTGNLHAVVNAQGYRV